MKRIWLAPVAIFLAILGVVNGPAEAKAAVPEFPSCISTRLDLGANRYWFDPGNLTPNIRSVQVEGVNMTRRRDGIWVADAPRPDRLLGRDVYFTYNFSEHKGNWAKCRKPEPRTIH